MPNEDLSLSFKPPLANTFCYHELTRSCIVIKNGFCMFKTSSNIYLSLSDCILASVWLPKVEKFFEMLIFVIIAPVDQKSLKNVWWHQEYIFRILFNRKERNNGWFWLCFVLSSPTPPHPVGGRTQRASINFNNSAFVLLFLKQLVGIYIAVYYHSICKCYSVHWFFMLWQAVIPTTPLN